MLLPHPIFYKQVRKSMEFAVTLCLLGMSEATSIKPSSAWLPRHELNKGDTNRLDSVVGGTLPRPQPFTKNYRHPKEWWGQEGPSPPARRAHPVHMVSPENTHTQVALYWLSKLQLCVYTCACACTHTQTPVLTINEKKEAMNLKASKEGRSWGRSKG